MNEIEMICYEVTTSNERIIEGEEGCYLEVVTRSSEGMSEGGEECYLEERVNIVLMIVSCLTYFIFCFLLLGA